jgi:acyl-coenzyme A synthetase/AMP-(fatty) acid ligase
MTFEPPERFNIAEYFLDARVREGRGRRTALVTDQGTLSYAEVQARANRFGHLLLEAGVEPEQRVLLALPDGPDFVAALFGTLKIGAVVVMVNPQLAVPAVEYFYAYTRARVAVTYRETADVFQAAARGAATLKHVLIADDPATAARLAGHADTLETFPSHRDDAAMWLFSGGTTGQPKAVVQTHTSFANTTECYAKDALGYRETDLTLSVPKLFFGYATGANLFFPFAVGATAVLFPERCTAEVLFEKIARYRPTIFVNVPTMVNQMVSHADAGRQDFSSLRFATSAGEALPRGAG